MTGDQLRFPLTGATDKNGKRRNRRVVTLTHLRNLKKYVGWMVTDWTVASTVYVPVDEREAQGLTKVDYLRPRRADEYPENDPKKWADLARWCMAVEVLAQDVRLWAREQEQLTRERLEKEQGAV